MIESLSQAGQDKFAFAMNEGKLGTFLDIGCHDGVTNNNTLALEREGWRGVLVDLQCLPPVTARGARFHQGDSTLIDYCILDAIANDGLVDFLSLDVDESTTTTLHRILGFPYHFKIICIEHDVYRLGPGPRDLQRQVLRKWGMSLVCADVVVDAGPGVPVGGPFEDWWVDPDLVPYEVWSPYLCDNKRGVTIVP